MGNNRNSTPCLSLRDVSYAWPSGFSLSLPSLDIYEGESIGFSGPNGSGKSTLLNLFAALTSPHHGSFSYYGRSVTSVPEFRREVTMLMQEPYLLKRSVFENIAYGLRRRKKVEGLEERVHDAMELVGLAPELFSTRKWYQLSGGEARRVALAARLVLEPRVLILDEPVSGIDAESALKIREALIEMRKKRSVTFLVTSHDLVWLDSVTDEILHIHGGRIIASGVENIFHGPWVREEGEIFAMTLSGKEKIFAGEPPCENAPGIIDPGDIMIAPHKTKNISAQNQLEARVMSMTEEKMGKGVRVTAETACCRFHCTITHEAQLDLKLYPGKRVFLLFKASSVRWG